MRWRVRLFDGPILETFSGEQVSRFRSRKVGALLSYLGLHLGRHCPREELADAIWPEEVDAGIVANRLRVTLASLRKQIEPSGAPFGSVIDVSMPGCIRLQEDEVWCDAIEADRAFRKGDRSLGASLMTGSLLPGYYEEWAVLERLRFDALADGEQPAALPAAPVEPTLPRRPRSPLPLYLTQFFGREKEIDLLKRQLESHRLVTVMGPGGMGKTRLAVQAAAQLPRDSVFVPLADISAGHEIAEAIVRALGASPSPQGDLIEQVVTLLNERQDPLLILDNAEHVVEETAEIVLTLLQAVADLGILVTTRQNLEVPGERTMRLVQLDLPAADTSEEDLARSPAIALFLDRAKIARPDFALSDRNAAAVLDICRVLEGVPFAIELAAARVVAQSPAQIAETLRSGLLELKSRQRGLSPRHRSLRASISGSVELLSGDTKQFLVRLAVFQGGWTSEAANAVAAVDDSEGLLEELVNRSLVVSSEDESTGRIRYRFLESIRQYALELLSEESLALTSAHHADYYLGLAAEVSEDDIDSLKPLDADQENLLTALEVGRGNSTDLYFEGLSGALTFAHVRGKHRTYRSLAEQAAEEAGSISDIQLRVRLGVSAYFVLSYLGLAEAVRALGSAILSDSQANDYLPGVILAKLILAFVGAMSGDLENALSVAHDALALARPIGDPYLVWRSLRMAAFLSVTRTRLGDLPSEVTDVLARQGEILSRECLETLPQKSTHQTFEWLTLAYILRFQRRTEEFYAALKHAQQTAIEHGMESLLLFGLREECSFAIETGAFEHAALVCGAFIQIENETGYLEVSHLARLEFKEDLVAALGKERCEALVKKGRRMRTADIVKLEIQPL